MARATSFFTGFKTYFWKKSTGLEVFKFGIYLLAPLGASVIYANPKLMHDIIMKLKLVEYPEAGPPPPIGDEINKFREKK
jgi:hypothetical protein